MNYEYEELIKQQEAVYEELIVAIEKALSAIEQTHRLYGQLVQSSKGIQIVLTDFARHYERVSGDTKLRIK